MKFAIITHAIHKARNGNIFAYEPYVREMNVWSKYVDEFLIVAPVSSSEITKIESDYTLKDIKLSPVSGFNIISFRNIVKTILVTPSILIKIYQAYKKSDHLHIRCPGNMGLLGVIVQVFFPKKRKTIKYAGNWDPKSKQPRSYRIQKWIISNTFLTKNAKVLVYGEWENQSKNIIPFFTASYSKNEILPFQNKTLKSSQIKLLYVGTLAKGKQPILSVKVANELIRKGYDIQLNVYGDGDEMEALRNYIEKNNLHSSIHLHGNQSKEVIKKAYAESHFLIFISKSEGWPKVVAESMFFSCLPISSSVSCIPFMLGDGERGSLISCMKTEIIANEIIHYIKTPDLYIEKLKKASEWSQNYTLEYFEEEIKKLLVHG